MNVELLNWSRDLRNELMNLCNNVDRSYLSDRLPSPYTEADADWWLGMVGEHDGKDGLFRAIVLDGKAVGSISVECRPDVYHRDCEIGYMLLTEYWSQGIMTEALTAVMEYLFDQVGMNRIEARHDVNNPHSGAVMKKCGMRYEGTHRAADRNNQGICDTAIYAMLRSER